MRTASWATLLALLVTTDPVQALQAQDPGEGVLLFQSRDMKGVETYYRVSPAVLDASPKWDPEKNPPPLSVAVAIEAARKFLGPPPNGTTYVLQSIDLMAVHGSEEARWYYSISFFLQTRWPTQSFDSRGVVILLDGTIVKPTTSQ